MIRTTQPQRRLGSSLKTNQRGLARVPLQRRACELSATGKTTAVPWSDEQQPLQRSEASD
jgi:hypothetical protein